MGGRTALMYALLYPARVMRLVLVDVVPSLQNPDSSISRIIEAMSHAQPLLKQEATIKRKDAEAIIRHELEVRGNHAEAVLQFLLLCNLQSREAGGYRWACNLKAIEKHLEQIVCWPACWLEEYGYKSVDLPLLLIAGGRSPYVEPQGWKLLLQYFPHTEAAPTIKKVIEIAYHLPHTETPRGISKTGCRVFKLAIAEFSRYVFLGLKGNWRIQDGIKMTPLDLMGSF